MAIVLIIGASSGIGLEAVRAALAAGHAVRALSRSAHSIAVDDPRLDKIAGDALDAHTVRHAVEGAAAVIQTLGVAITPSTVLGGTTLFSSATRVLVGQMQVAGIRRLIAVTGIEAGDSRGTAGFVHSRLLYPLILERIYADKTLQEAIIRESGLDWTIVRPAILTSGRATGRYRVLTDTASWRGGTISRRDVADYLVRQVEDRTSFATTPVLVA